MINIQELNKYIETHVFENVDGEITGEVMQSVLKRLIADLGVPINDVIKALEALQQDVTRLNGDVQSNSSKIAKTILDLQELEKSLGAEIADRQKKIEVVEIDYWGGDKYHATKNSQEIRNTIISGRDVVIYYNDIIYRYTNFDKNIAYFRFLNVSGTTATNEQIEIGWNGDATIKKSTFSKYDDTALQNLVKTQGETIETNSQSIQTLMESMKDVGKRFDVTPLYRATQPPLSPVSDDFYNKLQDAITTDKMMFIKDVNGEQIVNLDVIYKNKKNGEQIFTAFDGFTSFIFRLNTQTKLVDVNQERLGSEYRIFNNTSGNNVFNLSEASDVTEIIEVFTDARGDDVIPDTLDVFNVYENSNLTQSGVVFSRTEDEASLDIHILCNDIVKEYATIYHLQFSYNPSRGMSSLKVLKREEFIMDLALLTHDKQYHISEEVKKVAYKSEINSFNISALTGEMYDLQGAISALNSYLAERPKMVGLEIIFADSQGNPHKAMYKGKSFVSPSNWKELTI